MGGRSTGVILLLCALLAPAGVAAQDDESSSSATSGEDARARELFDLGDRLYEHGQYDAAIDAFREAYRLSHRPLMLFNLANAQERAGYLRDAVASLEGYLPHAPADEQTAVSNRLAALRERVAQAALDSAVVPPHETPETVPPDPPSVLPPPHVESPSQASADPDTISPSSPDLTAAGAFLGLAGAFVLAGVTLGVVALDQRSQVDARCVRASDGRNVCPDEVGAFLDTDTLVSAFADISFALAAASAALGVYSLVDALFEASEPETASDTSSLLVSFGVRAVVLPDAAYLGLRATFH